MRTRLRTVLLTVGLLAATLGTLGVHAYLSTPVISGVDPATPAPGPKTQMLTINGQEFMPGLKLSVTSPAGQTSVVQGNAITNQQATSFQAAVMLEVAGTYSLVVTNPDGGVSTPFQLAVKASPTKPQQDGPVIEKITPEDPAKRPDAQPLQIQGQRFSSGLRAIVTDPMGSEVPEVTVAKVTPNAFELMVRLEHTGEYTLVVKNPSGAVSNTARIMVR
jgi:hypothetical protein